MNKEINSNNFQTNPHNEGQQQNIAGQGYKSEGNEPPTLNDQQQNKNTRGAEQNRPQENESNQPSQKGTDSI